MPGACTLTVRSSPEQECSAGTLCNGFLVAGVNYSSVLSLRMGPHSIHDLLGHWLF